MFPRGTKERLWTNSIDHMCTWCGKEIMNMEHAEVDHVKPYSEGGTSTEANAQLLHVVCNRSKGAQPQPPLLGLNGQV